MGKLITLKAVANENYIFIGWKRFKTDTNYISDSSVLSVEASYRGDNFYYADFKMKSGDSFIVCTLPVSTTNITVDDTRMYTISNTDTDIFEPHVTDAD